jgi:hypothetical protein
MGRAGRDDIHESHLVLVQQALDGAVVHLVAGILRARKIHRLGGVGLDDALNRGAGPGQLVVMARDLHGHRLQRHDRCLEHFRRSPRLG